MVNSLVKIILLRAGSFDLTSVAFGNRIPMLYEGFAAEAVAMGKAEVAGVVARECEEVGIAANVG
jgi:hypothetical protein